MCKQAVLPVCSAVCLEVENTASSAQRVCSVEAWHVLWIILTCLFHLAKTSLKQWAGNLCSLFIFIYLFIFCCFILTFIEVRKASVGSNLSFF